MSPYTTPMAPKVSAAIEDLLEDTKNQPSNKTGLLFKVMAILRLFLKLCHGGCALKDRSVWKCCTAATGSGFRIL
jgi:hypothetical protein